MRRRVIALIGTSIVGVAFLAGYIMNSLIGAPAALVAGAAPPSTQTADLASATATGSSIDQATEHAYRTARKSVVYVDNPGNGTGSGIVYDATGDIVTNAHVTSGGKSYTVTFWNGKKVHASLVATDQADDLAVIHVNLTGLTPATFVRGGGFQVAETVLAIGSPIGLQDSVSVGLISGVKRTEQEPNGAYIPDAIQTSAPINPGNSGGALVDLNGDVVGIPTMVQTTTTGNEAVQNIGFAIPSTRVTFIVDQIVGKGKVRHTGRAFLGVVPSDSSSASGLGTYYQPSVSGALLTSVEANGPAGKAGLTSGDTITKLDGTPIHSSDDLLAALAGLHPGEKVGVTYDHNGSARSTSLLLGELPASE